MAAEAETAATPTIAVSVSAHDAPANPFRKTALFVVAAIAVLFALSLPWSA